MFPKYESYSIFEEKYAHFNIFYFLFERIRYLGQVAPSSVNFNHQLAYFADQSDTTHVPHQPTAVA